MREIAFIKQNKSKWLDYEELLKTKGSRDPDVLAEAYIHLLNDLSFAQTYYPKSKATVYLNFLVSQIYRKIYKTKRMERNRIGYFFVTEVPLLVYQNRGKILFAFVLFFFFAFIGAISARYDQTFVRYVLGDEYVNRTLNNIQDGDPMAIYKSGNALGSFLGITINNVLVAAKAYIFGITAGIFTFYIALFNGVMLGSFQYFFYQHHVLAESIKGIWLHGAMEIFSILISTAAGFMLASSFLFPRTYSRLYSFKTGIRDSLKIYLSTVPFFIAAGSIEGFVTRYSNTMPLWLNILIIAGTLSVISFYYLIYPFIIHKKQSYGRISILQET